jgi:hypothetical protein
MSFRSNRSGSGDNNILIPTNSNENTEEFPTNYNLLQPLLPPVHAEVVRDMKDHPSILPSAGDASHTSSMSEFPPSQEWKDHLCDCCIHGPCHPSLFCGCCFPSLGIAQVFFRILHHRRRKKLLFWSIALFVVAECLLGYWINLKLDQHCLSLQMDDGHAVLNVMSSTCAQWMALQTYVSLAFIVFTGVIIAVARHMVRKRYQIKPCIRTKHLCPSCCCCCCSNTGNPSTTNAWDEEWLEDCCISCCFPSCVSCQLMRQTGNYETYRASCCSYTGLPPGISYEYNS